MFYWERQGIIPVRNTGGGGCEDLWKPWKGSKVKNFAQHKKHKVANCTVSRLCLMMDFKVPALAMSGSGRISENRFIALHPKQHTEGRLRHESFQGIN